MGRRAIVDGDGKAKLRKIATSLPPGHENDVTVIAIFSILVKCLPRTPVPATQASPLTFGLPGTSCSCRSHHQVVFGLCILYYIVRSSLIHSNAIGFQKCSNLPSAAALAGSEDDLSEESFVSPDEAVDESEHLVSNYWSSCQSYLIVAVTRFSMADERNHTFLEASRSVVG